MITKSSHRSKAPSAPAGTKKRAAKPAARTTPGTRPLHVLLANDPGAPKVGPIPPYMQSPTEAPLERNPPPKTRRAKANTPPDHGKPAPKHTPAKPGRKSAAAAKAPRRGR